MTRVLSFEKRLGSVMMKPCELHKGDRCVKYLHCRYYDKCLDIAAKWPNFGCSSCPTLKEAEPNQILHFIIGSGNFNIQERSVYDLLKTQRIS